MTGGMAYEQFFCDDITTYVGKIAPVIRMPGEEEMRSLAEGACGCSTAGPSLWHTEHFSVHRRRPVTFGMGDGPPRRVPTS